MNKYITIHCADTPNGRDNTAKDIDGWHKDRGFNRDPKWVARFNPDLHHIGYHYVIRPNGVIETGRHPDETGAHVAGANTDNIGICLCGKDKFTHAQWNALRFLVTDLMNGYSIVAVKGHYEWPSGAAQGKTCPNFDVPVWFANKMTPENEHILEG